MSALLWRILIAAIVAVVLFTVLPPFFRIIGLRVSADLLLILQVCIAGILALYVLKTPPA